MTTETTQALSTFDPHKLAEMRAISNQGGGSRLTVPKIVIDYRDELDNGEPNKNEGGFVIETYEKNKDGSSQKNIQPLGKTIQGIILKKRILAKKYDKELKKTTYYTREFDSWKDPVELYDSNKNLIKTALYRDLKASHGISPDLILYIWMKIEEKENIYRLRLSASSMFTYGDYEKLFFETVVSSVITEFSAKQEKNGTNKYWLAQFNQVGLADFDKAYKLSKELQESLNLYEIARDSTNSVSTEPVDFENLPDQENVPFPTLI